MLLAVADPADPAVVTGPWLVVGATVVVEATNAPLHSGLGTRVCAAPTGPAGAEPAVVVKRGPAARVHRAGGNRAWRGPKAALHDSDFRYISST